MHMNTQQPKHSLAELQAMPDGELNALSATGLMGWKTDPDEPYSKLSWVAPNGTYCDKGVWCPTTNRNQSGQLLEWFTSRRFTASTHRDQCGVTSVTISHSDYGEASASDTSSARAETMAAILAHQALEKS